MSTSLLYHAFNIHGVKYQSSTYKGNTITFTKGPDAIANGDVDWIIETSTTLAPGSWTEEAAVEVGNTIAYTFTPGIPTQKFARLKVTVP